MDVILRYADEHVLDSAWASAAPGLALGREHLARQVVSLYVLTMIGTLVLYFGIATASYFFIFDKRMMKHPRFLKNQIRREIEMSVKGFPWLDLLTLPWFLGECRGYSLMYEGIENSPFGRGSRAAGIAYIVASSALFLVFTDLCIYLVHRVLHWPSVYKRLHKPHHKWVIPSPFASHAFHPLDGYAQSLPYHVFVYLVPLHKYTYLGLFVFVNLWSIFIHDSDMITGHPLERIINGPAHHTLHHMYFVYNYGQYFTWADRAGGSYRHPQSADDPLHDILRAEERRELLRREKQVAVEAYEREQAALRQAEREQDAGRTIMVRTASHAGSAASASTSSSGRSTPSDEKDDSGFEAGSASGSECSDSSLTAPAPSAAKRQLRRRK